MSEKEINAKKIEMAWSVLDKVKDPEIPVISIRELGILRDVYIDNDEYVVVITPTYSGCPAMEQIKADVTNALQEHNIAPARVELVLSPAWSTDWMTEEGRQKLKEYGIAPPIRKSSSCMQAVYLERLHEDDVVACPHCGSKDTAITSEFGSTACKSLYRCQKCLEPFDYFKPH